MQINKALQEAKDKLKANEIDEREARLLLAFSLGVQSEKLLLLNEIDDEQYNLFCEVIDKRCAHIPYAYITGHKEFMKIDFVVNENVLIPRDDTEILVQKAIELGNQNMTILDMCTGSGCIAISLAKYLKATMYAVDKSEKALEIAKINAEKNDVKINFVQSDLFNDLDEDLEFDMIVSNPPYIKSDVINTLQEEVKNNEPMMALNGGEDGVYFYRKISKEAKRFLKHGGLLMYEIGFDQAEEVKNILLEERYSNIEIIKDYSGNNRVVVAKLINIFGGQNVIL